MNGELTTKLRACLKTGPVRAPGLQKAGVSTEFCRPRAVTRRFTGVFKKALSRLAGSGLLLVACGWGAVHGIQAQGLPEPGVVLYGSVTNAATGAAVTNGSVTWRFAVGTNVATATGALTNLNGEFLYVVEMPFETVLAGMTLSSNTLAFPTVSATYGCTVNLNGTNVTILAASGTNLTIALADRGKQVRMNLQFTPAGTPETYETWSTRFFGVPNANPSADSDGDGRTNLQEYQDGTSPADAQSAIRTLVVSTGGGGASVTVAPNQASYANGTAVTLTPAPQAGYFFNAWTGTTNTLANPLSLAMTRDFTLTANFSLLSNAFRVVVTQLVGELNLLTVTNRATNINAPTLRFVFDGSAPAGAALDATNGVFTWTPSAAQGPVTNVIAVKVFDTNQPAAFATNTFTVVVHERPQVNAVATSWLVLVGDLVQLNSGAMGSGTLGYQWRLNGTNVSGATNSSLTLTNVASGNVGDYSVAVTNFAGGVTGLVARILAAVPPIARTASVGREVSFGMAVYGTKPDHYQWRKDGVPLAGQTNQVLLLSNVQWDDGGAYDVLFQAAEGLFALPAAMLTLTVPLVSGPPTIVSQPYQLHTIEGRPGGLFVAATGGNLAYQWKKDGVSVTGATNSALRLAAVAMADAGSYTLLVTNSSGSVTSAPISLLVGPALALPPTAAQAATVRTGGFRTTVEVRGGESYQVQFKNTLTDATWTVLGNFTASGTAFEFVDAQATNQVMRIYRVIPSP